MDLTLRTFADDLREMNRMMTRLFGKADVDIAGNGKTQLATFDWTPTVDVQEDDKAYTIQAELPQVKKEDVKINVQDGVLSLSGERRQEKETSGKRYHRIERSYGSFYRSFTLPADVDEANIEAHCEDGVLSIRLPKTARAKPTARAIPVS